MTDFSTEQEHFWAGDFGDEYSRRNRGDSILAANLRLFARILDAAQDVGSVLELGANVGLNLMALHQLLPQAELSGVEINREAYGELASRPFVRAHHGSILDLSLDERFDLVLTKGVLIHIAQDRLEDVYAKMVGLSRRYVCLAEYYNPTPVEVTYRGHQSRLFKRDFAGDLMDRYDLRLIDYGFVYHRDPEAPLDDITWFLMEKAR